MSVVGCIIQFATLKLKGIIKYNSVYYCIMIMRMCMKTHCMRKHGE